MVDGEDKDKAIQELEEFTKKNNVEGFLVSAKTG